MKVESGLHANCSEWDRWDDEDDSPLLLEVDKKNLFIEVFYHRHGIDVFPYTATSQMTREELLKHWPIIVNPADDREYIESYAFAPEDVVDIPG